MILALACHLKGPAINTYTVRVHEPELDELDAASLSARHIGAKPPIVQDFRDEDALDDLSTIDLRRGSAGDRHGLRRAAPAFRARSQLRTKSGADWRRRRRMACRLSMVQGGEADGFLDLIPGVGLSNVARNAYLHVNKVPHFPNAVAPAKWRIRSAVRMPGSMPTECSRFPSFASTARRCAKDLAQTNPWTELNFPRGTRQTMGSAPSRRLDCRASSSSRPSPSGQRRSCRDAFFGGSAIPVSGRRCFRFPGEAASALATARVPG